MELDRYQDAAAATDVIRGDEERGRVVALLGLAGESAELLSAYKKFLRDADPFALQPERVAEEAGDSLWYLAATATRFGLRLEDIAQSNLAKVRQRFHLAQPSQQPFFDEAFPERERLPRRFVVEFRPVDTERGPTVHLYSGGRRLGSPLRDNS